MSRNNMYEIARHMAKQSFLFIKIDAANVPEELLGELVTVEDIYFGKRETEPMFLINEYDEPIPMSDLEMSIC